MRALRFAAYGLIAVVLAGWGAWWVLGGGASRLGLDSMGSSVSAGVTVGGPFTLTDTAGHTVTDADYRGRWMLVYFGYTFCPDVCPTELQTVAGALDALGPEAAKLAPIFITIDPARDTPAKVGEFAAAFSPRLLGLTGTPAQVDQAAKAFAVYYARGKETTGGYLMDHSRIAYLMGPDGQPIDMLPLDKGPQATADDLAIWVK